MFTPNMPAAPSSVAAALFDDVAARCYTPPSFQVTSISSALDLHAPRYARVLSMMSLRQMRQFRDAGARRQMLFSPIHAAAFRCAMLPWLSSRRHALMPAR